MGVEFAAHIRFEALSQIGQTDGEPIPEERAESRNDDDDPKHTLKIDVFNPARNQMIREIADHLRHDHSQGRGEQGEEENEELNAPIGTQLTQETHEILHGQNPNRFAFKNRANRVSLSQSKQQSQKNNFTLQVSAFLA